METLEKTLREDFGLQLAVSSWLSDNADITTAAIGEKVSDAMHKAYQEKEAAFGKETLHKIEVVLMMRVLDTHWKEHLASMDHLRQGIGLRGFAQKNPKQEYKREAFRMFQIMLDTIRHSLASSLMKLNKEPELQPTQPLNEDAVNYQHQPLENNLPPNVPPPNAVNATLPAAAAASGAMPLPQDAVQPPPSSTQTLKPATVHRRHKKIGRNDPCFCGSGKKYKHCHGKRQ